MISHFVKLSVPCIVDGHIYAVLSIMNKKIIEEAVCVEY